MQGSFFFVVIMFAVFGFFAIRICVACIKYANAHPDEILEHSNSPSGKKSKRFDHKGMDFAFTPGSETFNPKFNF